MKLSLKACRVNVNATAKEMGEFVGVSADTIYNWETGKHSPRAAQIPKIIEFFNSKGFPVELNNLNFLP